MKLFVPRESEPGETRVAMSPEVVRKLGALGFSVAIEPGAGLASRIPDADFVEAGAKISADGSKADVVFRVRRPNGREASSYKKGAIVLAGMDPHGNEGEIKGMAKAGISAFAMEFMPRITRAQVMDILSSQANLAGYQAVIEASAEYDRALPMMMTAAGTIPAARVFVMGVGVAGLQAIATARRLGAIVTATDVRPATKEQVESLGAKFVAVEDEEFKQAETSGGYAKEMSKEYQAKQAELIAGHIAKQDIVITTALIPGRPAPRLVSKKMMANMGPGSVLVDLAVERGGNIEGAIADKVARVGNVSIIGYMNMAGRIGATASLLYAKNLYAFLETMVDAEAKSLKVDWDDELVTSTLLTKDGKVVHPAFTKKPASATKSKNKSVVEAKPKPIAKSVVKPAAKIAPAVRPNVKAKQAPKPVVKTKSAPKPVVKSKPVTRVKVKSVAKAVRKSIVKPKPKVAQTVKRGISSTKKTTPQKAPVENAAPDDLTRISGVGPAIVRKLDKIGVRRFAQMAQWTLKEQKEFGGKLAFPGRVEREKWVEQAKQLAGGKKPTGKTDKGGK